MTDFNEYQKKIRYKHGYYSFIIVLILWGINYFLGISGFHWGQTKEIEIILILFGAVFYFVVMNTYQGAFFKKKYNSKFLNHAFFILGILFLANFVFYEEELIVEGKITAISYYFAIGLILITIPIISILRLVIHKQKGREDG